MYAAGRLKPFNQLLQENHDHHHCTIIEPWSSAATHKVWERNWHHSQLGRAVETSSCPRPTTAVTPITTTLKKRLIVIASTWCFSLSIDAFDLVPADELESPHYHHEVTARRRHQPQRRNWYIFHCDDVNECQRTHKELGTGLYLDDISMSPASYMSNLTICPCTHKHV